MKCGVTVAADAIVGQLESSDAATLVGAHRVLTMVSAESVIIPALIQVYKTHTEGRSGIHPHTHAITTRT